MKEDPASAPGQCTFTDWTYVYSNIGQMLQMRGVSVNKTWKYVKLDELVMVSPYW